jgi:hypothetical protein
LWERGAVGEADGSVGITAGGRTSISGSVGNSLGWRIVDFSGSDVVCPQADVLAVTAKSDRKLTLHCLMGQAIISRNLDQPNRSKTIRGLRSMPIVHLGPSAQRYRYHDQMKFDRLNLASLTTPAIKGLLA